MLFIGAGKADAQWVVHDPGHTFLNSTEWYTNVKKWIEQIKEMEAAQKLREGLQNIDRMKELKSLKELADLLDDVACLSQDYSFYMNVGSNYHCLKFLNFSKSNSQSQRQHRPSDEGSNGNKLFLDELRRKNLLYRTGKGVC